MRIPKQKVKLPEAAIPLLRYLQDNGSKSQKDLIEALGLPIRTVRYSIRRLLEKKLIDKVPNLSDMRSVYYKISQEIIDLEQVITDELNLIHS